VDTSTHHLSTFGHHVTIGTGFPIYEGGEEGLLPSVNILHFHCSTLASIIQTTFTKVSTDLIPAAPLWQRDSEDTWELAKNLSNAQAKVVEFHAVNPGAPQKIAALIHASLPWQSPSVFTSTNADISP
jgi:hypothetical protein